MKRLVAALRREPTDRRPVWVMRQAGRHLPEYRELRASVGFNEAVSTPEIAAEITLQPIRRYGMDGAVVFADIMTPLQAMGVDVEFTPGPSLRPHSLAEVAALPPLDVDRVGHVAETIALVAAAVPDDTAVVGFAGAPFTLLAYLVEGGGSKDFAAMRGAVLADPAAAGAALENLAHSMAAYLGVQVTAGAEAVQLFDSWAGMLDEGTYRDLAMPAARSALDVVGAPRIYFAPHGPHLLGAQTGVGADAHGVDWRLPIDEVWHLLGDDVAVQGNLDPAVLLTDPDVIAARTTELLAATAGRPGHVVNLGHGIDRTTPPEHVAAFVSAVREGPV